jgi:hypothetical protein
MAPQSHCTPSRFPSSGGKGKPRDRRKPIRLEISTGKDHRIAVCGRVPAAGAVWHLELHAGGRPPLFGPVRPIGTGEDSGLPATNWSAFLGASESRRPRITWFQESSSPASHLIVGFACGGHMRIRRDFTPCCTLARAPPPRGQRDHALSCGKGRVCITSSTPS